ncbi:MAG: phytoene/squalene synthase family protein [Deltaproteobacteria bacterium]|nr:phytoene/squalene synthase family protein [Deltaproteobacteria bacterium]
MKGDDHEDLEACFRLLRQGSKSFHTASWLLPPRLRPSVAAIYAFCRVADDAVDDSDDPAEGLALLEARLDGIYDGSPIDHPVDRALMWVVKSHSLPREPLDALLEGFAWDVAGRRYETLSELREYCVRVAASVGLLMTALMGERRSPVLARAADLGIAMQLTNIARDVGEDARGGRIYLPREWLAEVGLEVGDLVPEPQMSRELGVLIRRLLAAAETHYLRARGGVSYLPRDCRVAIAAAGSIYRDIGRVIVDNQYDSVNQRAYTSKRRKAWLFVGAVPSLLGPVGPPVGPPAAPEAQALVAALAGPHRNPRGR